MQNYELVNVTRSYGHPISGWEAIIHIPGPNGGKYIWPFNAFTKLGLRFKAWRFMRIYE